MQTRVTSLSNLGDMYFTFKILANVDLKNRIKDFWFKVVDWIEFFTAKYSTKLVIIKIKILANIKCSPYARDSFKSFSSII